MVRRGSERVMYHFSEHVNGGVRYKRRGLHENGREGAGLFCE